MLEDKNIIDEVNPYDELKGFFPEEYDLSPDELLAIPDCDSFDMSEFSPIWEDLDDSADTTNAEEPKKTDSKSDEELTPKAKHSHLFRNADKDAEETNEDISEDEADISNDPSDSIDGSDIYDDAFDKDKAFSEAPSTFDTMSSDSIIDEDEDAKNKKKRSLMRDIYDIVEMFAICTACIILFFSFFARLTIVDGDSMNDTLQHGEFLVISNFMYEPEHGDIVVLQDTSLTHPELQKPLIKRIIAIGGETVDITATGIVTITKPDGTSYIVDEQYTKDEVYAMNSGHYEVPEGCVFVMGDNRNGSTDSRDDRVGYVDQRCIIGKAFFQLLPFNEIGTITNPFDKE